ncbi:papilin-like isoform X2 [Littorina saxatilis]|uniref:papilin-like isoform X2 n=1 Tax=Littorina saxatilis TaxID=31220 RepID=UPI0038B67BB7
MAAEMCQLGAFLLTLNGNVELNATSLLPVITGYETRSPLSKGDKLELNCVSTNSSLPSPSLNLTCEAKEALEVDMKNNWTAVKIRVGELNRESDEHRCTCRAVWKFTDSDYVTSLALETSVVVSVQAEEKGGKPTPEERLIAGILGGLVALVAVMLLCIICCRTGDTAQTTQQRTTGNEGSLAPPPPPSIHNNSDIDTSYNRLEVTQAIVEDEVAENTKSAGHSEITVNSQGNDNFVNEDDLDEARSVELSQTIRDCDTEPQGLDGSYEHPHGEGSLYDEAERQDVTLPVTSGEDYPPETYQPGQSSQYTDDGEDADETKHPQDMPRHDDIEDGDSHSPDASQQTFGEEFPDYIYLQEEVPLNADNPDVEPRAPLRRQLSERPSGPYTTLGSFKEEAKTHAAEVHQDVNGSHDPSSDNLSDIGEAADTPSTTNGLQKTLSSTADDGPRADLEYSAATTDADAWRRADELIYENKISSLPNEAVERGTETLANEALRTVIFVPGREGVDSFNPLAAGDVGIRNSRIYSNTIGSDEEATYDYVTTIRHSDDYDRYSDDAIVRASQIDTAQAGSPEHETYVSPGYQNDPVLNHATQNDLLSPGHDFLSAEANENPTSPTENSNTLVTDKNDVSHSAKTTQPEQILENSGLTDRQLLPSKHGTYLHPTLSSASSASNLPGSLQNNRVQFEATENEERPDEYSPRRRYEKVSSGQRDSGENRYFSPLRRKMGMPGFAVVPHAVYTGNSVDPKSS